MTSKRALQLFFLLMAVYGAVVGYCVSHNTTPSNPVEFLFTAASAVLIYLWYYFDAAEQKYKRTAVLGGAVIALSLLAIPYYLARSRPEGQKVKAILRFLGVGVLSLAVVCIAALPFVLLGEGA